MIKFYTYLYIDPKYNIPVYVGKGQGERASSHLKKNHNLRFNRLLKRRQSQGILITPIINVEYDEQTALEMEKFWINQFGRRDLGLGTLLNLTDGGENTNPGEETKQKIREARARQVNVGHVPKGHKLTEEHKEKIRQAGFKRTVSEATKEKIRQANLGKKLSQELKDQISAKLKGKPLTDEHKKNMAAGKLRNKK